MIYYATFSPLSFKKVVVKKLMIFFFLFACFGLNAQKRWYVVGGLDSYQVLNKTGEFPAGFGFHGGLQRLLTDETKYFHSGIEGTLQYRRQSIDSYGGANPNVLIGADKFNPSYNFQLNPFLGWGVGPVFLDLGAFLNLRLSNLGIDTDTMAAPVDFGATTALSVRSGIVFVALKAAYGFNDVGGESSRFGVISTKRYINSLNLSFEAGFCLNSVHKQ